ncbi:MAG: hypothetical protein NT146_14940 [Mycobacterium sp.]|nr:hypothetical protein [Mycobacterium sp.]
MRKLVLVLAGVTVAGSAVALGIGASNADPSSSSTYNVVGEPYAKAVAILRAQGVKTTFGGSVGSDVPQSQCVVSSQKVTSSAKMQLMLDCTAAAQPEQPAATSAANAPGTQSTDAGNRPTAGAPGVVTVIPTPVG